MSGNNKSYTQEKNYIETMGQSDERRNIKPATTMCYLQGHQLICPHFYSKWKVLKTTFLSIFFKAALHWPFAAPVYQWRSSWTSQNRIDMGQNLQHQIINIIAQTCATVYSKIPLCQSWLSERSIINRTNKLLSTHSTDTFESKFLKYSSQKMQRSNANVPLRDI